MSILLTANGPTPVEAAGTVEAIPTSVVAPTRSVQDRLHERRSRTASTGAPPFSVPRDIHGRATGKHEDDDERMPGVRVTIRRPTLEHQRGRRYLRMPVGSVYKMTGPKRSTGSPPAPAGTPPPIPSTRIDRWLDLLLVSNSDLMVRVRQQALKVRGTDGQDQRKAAA